MTEKNKGGRPLKYETAKEMQKVIDNYFESVRVKHDDDYVFRPTMAGLALALNMCRQSLLNYSEKDEFLDTIKSARQKVEVALEEALYGTGVAGVIFNLKNNFDWKDKQEIDQKSEVTVIGIQTEF